MSNNTFSLMDKVVSLCKRRGFVYPGSEIYGGLAGTWDYGPNGVIFKNNIKNIWWRQFITERDDVFGIDTGILMNRRVWEASGHTVGFTDELAQCALCKKRFRTDNVASNNLCPECGGKLSVPVLFNMMFQTEVGFGGQSHTFLRPETAQGMFVNFKNIVDSFHPTLPFGIAQIGRAFRNEIAPRDFLFRTREFEQLEIEYFVRPHEWQQHFENWRAVIWRWIESIGLQRSHVHEREVGDDERSHYSLRTIDFEFDFPFGRKELYGLAYRSDYDLRQHSEMSSVDFLWRDEVSDEPFIPHCIEPSLGLDRTILAILCDSYAEDELGGEKRIFLKLRPELAPIKTAVFPLLKNRPQLVERAEKVYRFLRHELGGVAFDDNGNIGKRYRRQDEIGTPFCVTIDFQTLEDETVTVRDRDSGSQQRVLVPLLAKHLKERLDPF